MNKKNTILTLGLVFCLVLALGVGNANAGPSQYYFDDYDCAYVEVAPLGTFLETTWTILVKVPLYGGDVSLGMSFWHRTSGALCIHVDHYGMWYSHSYEGVWAGSGSDFIFTTSQLYSSVNPLTTSPPSITSDSSADPAAQ